MIMDEVVAGLDEDSGDIVVIPSDESDKQSAEKIAQIASQMSKLRHASDDDASVISDFSAGDSVREAARLAERPNIEYLQIATGSDESGNIVPLFSVGARIVVERLNPFAAGNPWLDTRCYIVKKIDLETGILRCTDELASCAAFVSFKHPLQTVRLAPAKGDPFETPEWFKKYSRNAATAFSGSNAPDIQRAAEEAAVAAAAPKKGRGRPKGSKNRPKEEIKAEKLEKKRIRAEKKLKPKNRKR